MPEDERLRRFEEAVLPHLDSAYNLARWLTGDDQDARDAVQDACVRALRHFDGFRGGDARPWLLAIVRHAAYDRLKARSGGEAAFDEESAPAEAAAESVEAELARAESAQALARALAGLPAEFREALVLRELEGLSYKEIAAATGAPIGTVMSRLARGRKLLLGRLGGGTEARS